jgi:hypothetical protein
MIDAGDNDQVVTLIGQGLKRAHCSVCRADPDIGYAVLNSTDYSRTGSFLEVKTREIVQFEKRLEILRKKLHNGQKVGQ